jgi:hypothetical protein
MVTGTKAAKSKALTSEDVLRLVGEWHDAPENREDNVVTCDNDCDCSGDCDESGAGVEKLSWDWVRSILLLVMGVALVVLGFVAGRIY